MTVGTWVQVWKTSYGRWQKCFLGNRLNTVAKVNKFHYLYQEYMDFYLGPTFNKCILKTIKIVFVRKPNFQRISTQ